MGYGNMTQTQNNFPRLPLLFVLIPFIISTPNVFAQADTGDVMQTPAHLAMQKLAWLEGTWEGEGDVPGAGKYISQMTYVTDLNGHIIRHDYQALQNGIVVWRDQGMIAYNEDLNELVTITIGIDGSFGQGAGTITDSAYTIVGHTAGETPYKDWRTIVTKIDDSTARTRFEYKKGDSYEFFSEEIMRKQKVK